MERIYALLRGENGMSKWIEKEGKIRVCSLVSISEQTSEQVFDQTDVFLLTTPTFLP